MRQHFTFLSCVSTSDERLIFSGHILDLLFICSHLSPGGGVLWAAKGVSGCLGGLCRGPGQRDLQVSPQILTLLLFQGETVVLTLNLTLSLQWRPREVLLLPGAGTSDQVQVEKRFCFVFLMLLWTVGLFWTHCFCFFPFVSGMLVWVQLSSSWSERRWWSGFSVRWPSLLLNLFDLAIIWTTDIGPMLA